MLVEQVEDADPPFRSGGRESNTRLGLAKGKDTNQFCPPHLVDRNNLPQAWASGRHRGRSGTTQSEKGKIKAATSNITQKQPISGSYNRSSRARALEQQREIQIRRREQVMESTGASMRMNMDAVGLHRDVITTVSSQITELENEDVTLSVKQFSSPRTTPKISYEAFRGGPRMTTLRNDPASDDSEFGSGTAGRRNISPFHDPYDSDIGNPNGDTEPHHRAANDLAKQRQKQNEMKCLDNEKSLLSAETLDITRTSSPRCDSKGDGTQSLSRPYFCKPDEAEEIHGSYDSQNEDRKDQWGKNQESKQGIVTADDEPCKDSYTVDCWNNEGGVNQEKGGLKAQMHASNYNLDEKDANDSVEESKDDSYSSSGYCRKTSLKQHEFGGMGRNSCDGTQPVTPEAGENLKANTEDLNLSRALDVSNIKDFLVNPCSKEAGVVQCYIHRKKYGPTKKSPEYYLYMKEGDRFLMCAKKRPHNKTSNYLVSMQAGDLDRISPNFLGKLRANFVGTGFQIFSEGVNPKSPNANHINVRRELGAIVYASNILGSRGPRKMQVGLPNLKEDGSFREFLPSIKEDNLPTCIKYLDYENMIYLINKPPRWNEQVGAYVLNFRGRVTMASVKNFQLVEPDKQENILVQFGRVDKNEFTMDFQWPISPLQAFSIALSSLDSKIACD